jgi:class 3 adenylate cyclase
MVLKKSKTIGDSYMAAGGLPVRNTTHATDVVNAAIEIQQFMLDYKEKKEAEGKTFF